MSFKNGALLIRDEKGELKYTLKPSEMLGQKLGFALQIRSQSRKFNGIVSSFQVVRSTVRDHFMHLVEVVPPAWILTLNQRCQLFHDKKATDIVAQVLQDGAVASQLKSSGAGLSGSVTHLLHRALQLALDFHAEAAGPGALTQRQYTVLTATAAHQGLTQNDLVRATGIDRSTLADLVARMLTKGLLVRDRSTTDARANWVRLSEAGQLALASGAGPASAADNRLLAHLSPKKRESFVKTLSALAAAADMPAGAKAAKGAKKREAKQSKSDKVAKSARAVAVKPAKKAKKDKIKKARRQAPA